jgi:RNA polymerase sigma factor (sigma-70 family)
MDDSLIIDLYFERNEQAIAETQSKYGRLCASIAGGILKRHEDAEEAVSTSYVKLWNAIPPKRPESLCGYLCRIVRNTALNVYDSMKRRSCEELYGELADVIPDMKTSDDHFDSAEIAGHLNEFLRNSKPKNRDIFTGRYYFNLSVREIADRMGMTETAVKTRLSRIRADLREYLVENGVSVD